MELSVLEASPQGVSYDQPPKSLLNVESRIELIQNLETKRKKDAIKKQKYLEHVLGALQRLSEASTSIFFSKTTPMLESIHHTKLLASTVFPLKDKMKTAQKSAETLRTLRTELETLRQEATTVHTPLVEKQRDTFVNQTSKDLSLSLDSAHESEHFRTLAIQAETLTDFIEAIIPSDSQILSHTEKRTLAFPSLQSSPSVPFIRNKGKLPLPVTGTLVRAYGEPDGYGSASKGLSIATRPQTLVTAPVDGRVLFSGPFRSFQQLLIIDAGHGYHIVLAGMYEVRVVRGQFVLSGEPIARMGDIPEQSAVPLTGGAGMPVCYMEIRRGSIPIDPGPWLDQKTITQITQQ